MPCQYIKYQTISVRLSDHIRIISALEELVNKFPNGYVGPYQCKGEQTRPNGQGIGDGDSTVLEVPDSTIIVGEHVTILPSQDGYQVSSRDESAHIGHIDSMLETQGELPTADAVGTLLSEPGNSSSVVRFGESAASPTGGSQAELHTSSR